MPSHRMTPLKQQWMKIYTPLVEQMKLQVRMNTRAKCVELKVILIYIYYPLVSFAVVPSFACPPWLVILPMHFVVNYFLEF